MSSPSKFAVSLFREWREPKQAKQPRRLSDLKRKVGKTREVEAASPEAALFQIGIAGVSNSLFSNGVERVFWVDPGVTPDLGDARYALVSPASDEADWWEGNGNPD